MAKQEPQSPLPGWLNRKTLARSIGISVQSFDQWGIAPVAKIGREVFYDVASVLEADRARVERRREKERPQSLDDIDYERERARLTREQADHTALKNAQLRRESAPIAVIEWTLGRVLAQAAATLDAIPVKVKRRLPKLSAAEIEIIKREIAKVRNLAARVQVDIDEYRADQRTGDRG